MSMGFYRQGCQSGLPFPSPGDLPNPGMKPVSLMSPALAGEFCTEGISLIFRCLENMQDKELNVRRKIQEMSVQSLYVLR